MAAVTVIAKDGDIYIETGSQTVYKAHNVYQALGAFIKDDPVFCKATDEHWTINDGKEQCFRVWRCSYLREKPKSPVCPRNVTFVKEV